MFPPSPSRKNRALSAALSAEKSWRCEGRKTGDRGQGSGTRGQETVDRRQRIRSVVLSPMIRRTEGFQNLSRLVCFLQDWISRTGNSSRDCGGRSGCSRSCGRPCRRGASWRRIPPTRNQRAGMWKLRTLHERNQRESSQRPLCRRRLRSRAPWPGPVSRSG